MIRTVITEIRSKISTRTKLKFLFLEIVFSVIFYFLPKAGTFLSVIGIMFGIITFFLIPGYIVSTFFGQWNRLIETLGFGLLFGLGLQTFNVLLLYAAFPLISIDFTMSVIVLTLFFTTLLTLFLAEKKQNEEKNKDKWEYVGLSLLCIILIALFVRLYFQGFNTQMFTPDGALYMDVARNVVETGKFSLKIFPYHSYWTEEIAMAAKLQAAIGGGEHPVVSFMLALFFMFGGPSQLSAKLMEVFCGVLVVFLVYTITRKLLGERTALIASLMISFEPLMVFYSIGLFNGTETPSILFLMATLYFIILAIKRPEKLRFAALAGVFWSFSFLCWQASAEAFLAVIPFLFIFLSEKHKLNIKSFLFVFLVPIIIEIYYAFVTSIPVLFLYVTVSFISLIIVLKRARDLYIKGLSLFLLTSVIVMQITNIRGYFFPEIFNMFQETGSTATARVLSLFPTYSQIIAFSGRMIDIWQRLGELTGPLILILAFLSFLNTSHLKEKTSIFLYPLFYSILFSVFGPLSYGISQARFYPFVIPFMVILSSSVLDALIIRAEEKNKTSKRIVSIKLKGKSYIVRLGVNWGRIKKICIFSFLTLLLLCFFNFYNGGYSGTINMINEFDTVSNVEMTPAVHWIKENTPQNSVFLALATQEYAWLTDRTCAGVRSLNIEQLYEAIHIYKADYFISDKSVYDVSPELSGLYDNPYASPPGFVLVFNYSGSKSNVFIFDVRRAQTINLTEYEQQIEANRASCLIFDGTDDYIKVPNSSSLNITDQITIEAWIKLSETPTGPERIVAKRDSNGESWVLTTGTTRKIYFALWSGGNYSELASTSTILLDTWVYCAATYDGSYMRLYLDGHLNAEKPQTGSIDTSMANVTIGAENDGSVYHFNGSIDEVCISSRALTEYEIVDNSLKGELGIVNGTVALWHFNEGSGDTVHDETGNHNDGIIYGATWHK